MAEALELFEYQEFRIADYWKPPDYVKWIDGLNALAAEGWRVIAPLTGGEQMGVAHATLTYTDGFLLERRRLR